MKRRNFLQITLPAALTGQVITSPEDPALFSFGVIADPQYADVDPKGSRHYRKSLEKLKASIEILNSHKLKFVVTLGDVIDRNFSSFNEIMPIYEDLRAPRRFVLGNHDFTVDETDKPKVLERLGQKKAYHTETFGDWRFIYLDGTDVSTYRYGKDHPLTTQAKTLQKKLSKDKKRQMPSYGGALGEKQMQWFSKELEKAKTENKRVVIFNHYPTFPLKDAYNIWNDSDLVTLISQNPHVVAYLNGHRHKGHYAINEGCHYVNLKGMVETANQSAFAVVRCYADRLEIEGFETEVDRTCKFEDEK